MTARASTEHILPKNAAFHHRAIWAWVLWLTLSVAVTNAAPATPTLDTPHPPFRIFGNTYYVGTKEHSAILVDTDAGLVLIDAGLAESVPLIKANIAQLGFKVTDLKAILSSDAQARTAGGLAQLQRDSGAEVFTLRPNEASLRTGQAAVGASRRGAATFPPVSRLSILHDDQLLGQGLVRFKVFSTPGRSPGASSWRWQSCEGAECMTFVYAPALIPEDRDGWHPGNDPQARALIEAGLQRLETTSCDVLLTATPAVTELLQRLDPRSPGRGTSIKEEMACQRYAQSVRAAMATHGGGGR